MTGACPVLVSLRAAGLGDLLTAVPALRALRRAFPDHDHLLVGPAALAPLALATGAVDGVRDLEARAAPPDHTDAPAAEIDVAVNLHGRGPQSSALLASWSPGRLVAFAHPDVPATTDGPIWRDHEPERERWCRLLTESGFAADPTDLRVEAPAGAEPSSLPPGTILLHPGAASEARRWPATRFAQLGRRLRSFGHPVAVTAGPGELPLATAVAHHVPDARVVDCAGDVLHLLATVARASAVVCGDTGVAHVATATGTPSVVIFGPVSPARWGPPPGAQHRALWAGHTGDPHAPVPDPGLLAIGVDDVEDALHLQLAERRLSGRTRG